MKTLVDTMLFDRLTLLSVRNMPKMFHFIINHQNNIYHYFVK